MTRAFESTEALLLDRRALIGSVAATGLLAAMPAFGRVGAPVAETRAGKVRGVRADGVNIFRSVRYGATTAGRRFEPPLPPQPWAGIQDATAYANQAPQLGAERPTVYASWSNPRPDSEDCLFLNVYTPGLRDGKKRPVLVWFHGGGFFRGSPYLNYADGTRLAGRNEVVVVTVSHRLNAFGYLYLADLAPDLADSGNTGNLDMLLSLQWVRDNIAEFGGDPGNVTIFGQSGGGLKVSTLMAMPTAKGLFHKAIVQSGSGLRMFEPEQAAANTAKALRALELGTGDIDRLRSMDFRQITTQLLSAGADFRPVVDGRSLPRHPFDPDAPAASINVPLMVGTCKDETTDLTAGYDPSFFELTWETLPVRLEPRLAGMDVARVVEELRRIHPQAKPSDIFFTATTDYQFRTKAIRQAERKAAQGGAPAYMYMFAWETPVEGGRWKSPHSMEHAFVFDNVAKSESMVGNGPIQRELADTVSRTWARFARMGDPGWAAYKPQTRATMIFDARSQVQDDPMPDERLLFAHIPT